MMEQHRVNVLLHDQTGRSQRPDHLPQSAPLSDAAVRTQDPHAATREELWRADFLVLPR